ncbi:MULTISPECIES: acetyltransferase [Crateriforma]|uniref:Acetyltransferase n=1 Tax=Crateriforma conspicua TaxID=2527996 RepID=A0A5C6FNF9_9PLAN|nr:MULTISPECIES: acetyltransferase [Crateriforma]TWU62178.1 hypothetical protein V7x_39070 [Crateriforma conspicua]
MFLKEKKSGDLIQIQSVEQLFSPLMSEVVGRRQAGEEEQEEQRFGKSDLVFPSDELLPKCWTDPDYQKDA